VHTQAGSCLYRRATALKRQLTVLWEWRKFYTSGFSIGARKREFYDLMVMTHKKITRILLFVSLMTGVLPLHARQMKQGPDDFESLLRLSLEDLAALTVTVSSYKPESIVETPAIISRYDARKMAGIGLRTLQDMLSFIPGITVQDHLFGQPFVSMRGIYEGFNQKVLFLLDDTPYFMPSHSDVPILGIPIESIDHIEVIRGPGAVYYGTNATAGVIKVVTRKDKDNSLTLRVGENRYANGGGYMGSGGKSWGKVSAAFELQRDDGYRATYPAYSDGNASFDEGLIDKRRETSSALLNYHYKGFKAQAHVFETMYTGIAEPRQVENFNEIIYKGYLFGLRNDWQSERSTVSLFMDYNNFHPEFEIDNFFSDGGPAAITLGNGRKGGFRFENGGRKNYRWRSGVTASYKLRENLGLFLGTEHERRSSGDYQVFDETTGAITGSIYDDFDLTENSLYGELDYRPAEHWRFLFGGRFTDNSITGGDVVPRLSSIYQINKRQSIKLLYSVGFNAPSFSQLKADIPPFVVGNEDLKPEKVKSLDLAYTYANKGLLFVANIWQMHANDFILNRVVDGTKSFFNAGDFSREGLELDIQYSPAPEMKMYSNVAYYRGGDSYSERDMARKFIPEWTLNIGGYGQFLRRNTAGFSLRYIGARARAGSLWLMNLDYQFRWKYLRLFATLENLLDEEVLHPNMGELSDRLTPGGQDRNIKLGIRYFF